MGKPWKEKLANAKHRRDATLAAWDAAEEKHGVELGGQEQRGRLRDLDELEFRIVAADLAGDTDLREYLVDAYMSAAATTDNPFAVRFIHGPLAAGAKAWRDNPPDHDRWCALAHIWLEAHDEDRGRGYRSRLCEYVAKQVHRTPRRVRSVLKERGIL